MRDVTANRKLLLLALPSLPIAAAAAIGFAGRSVPDDALHPHESFTGKAPPEGCATGCSAVPESAYTLPRAEIRRCIDAMATQQVGTASIELETLLFHSGDVRRFAHHHGLDPLSTDRQAFLRRHLAMREASVSVRVTDESGIERIRFAQNVPIGEKQHLHVDDATDITPPELGFTVKRVGLYHLWTRI